MGTRLTQVPFDIETTGFAVDDEVTVVGFVLPLGCRVFCQTGGQRASGDRLEVQMHERFGPHLEQLTITVHESERSLLDAFALFVRDTLSPREYLLTAYNGEQFRGGFDLPFLRTRLARLDIAWPFGDLPYADLLPIFRNRFNTVVDGDDSCPLERAYEVLVGTELTDCDPFTDSGSAVSAFTDDDFEQLVAHNVADILRTDSLATVAERYCGKSEFKLKSLTPTVADAQLQ